MRSPSRWKRTRSAGAPGVRPGAVGGRMNRAGGAGGMAQAVGRGASPLPGRDSMALRGTWAGPGRGVSVAGRWGLVGGGGGVADRDGYAGLGAAGDEVGAGGPFGGKGEEANAAGGGFLPALERVPVGRTDEFFGVRAAGAVFGGDEGAFEVDAGDGA